MTRTSYLPRVPAAAAVFALLLSLSVSAWAGSSVVLGWDPNPPEEKVTGYILRAGPLSRQSPEFRAYPTEVDVGNTLEWTLPVPDGATQFFFSITPYNAAGIEGESSDEVAVFAMSATPGTCGTISPAGVTLIPGGTDHIFSILPDNDCRVQDVTADGVSVGALASYTFRGVNASHKIGAVFASIPNYTVTLTAGPRGAVNPNGMVAVRENQAVSFSVTPDANCKITDVLVDGVSVGAVPSYTIASVKKNLSVLAAFAKETRSISVGPGKGGGIRPKSSPANVAAANDAGSEVLVEYGGTAAFDIVPAANYSVADVTVDGVSVGAVASYEFRNVTGNHSLAAVFAPADADSDGLPDEWEKRYFKDLRVDASADPDRDGITNRAELANGTDPTRPDVNRKLNPSLAEPVSGGTVTSQTPQLSVYNPVNPPSGVVTFRFEVATDPEMVNIVASEEGLAQGIGMTTWVVPARLLDKTQYYWRVRTTTGRESSEWMEVCTFRVDTAGQPTVATVETTEYVVPGNDTIVEVADPTKATDGVVVEMPADTLPGEAILTVGTVENPPPAPNNGTRLLGKVVELGPHGKSFAKPVTIMLPYKEEHLAAAGVAQPDKLSILTYSTAAFAWRRVPLTGVDYLRRRLMAKVDHFSMYAVGVSDEAGAEPGTGSIPLPSDGAAGATQSAQGGGGGGGGCFLRTLK